MTHDQDPILLDLDQFESPDDAIAKITRERGFDNVVKPFLTEVIGELEGPTLLLVFCQSAITRANGLYTGIVREIGKSNHPAVFVLMRQLAETVAVVRYVADKPSYLTAVQRPEREWKPGEPRRKSMQALVNYMDRRYSTQLKHVYGELSELCHFGSTAVWQSHMIVGDHRTVWSSRPAWRDHRTIYVACAQVLELGDAMAQALLALCEAVRLDAKEAKLTGRFFEVGDEGVEIVTGESNQGA